MLGQRRTRWANIKPVQGQRFVYTATTHWANAGLMLGQRRTRWADFKPPQGQRLVYTATTH